MFTGAGNFGAGNFGQDPFGGVGGAGSTDAAGNPIPKGEIQMWDPANRDITPDYDSQGNEIENPDMYRGRTIS